MKKLIIAVSVLVFFGCSEPQLEPTFNPNDKSIIMEGGEYFRVPNETNYYTMKTTNLDSINFYKNNGFICNKNDLLWVELTSYKRLSTVRRLDIFDRFVITMWKKDKIGCAHPLTEKEYRFYRSQEIENQANRRTAIQSNIAYMNAYNSNMNAYFSRRHPQTVNVNLKGAINHNIRYGY